jgi:hypothetical protein
MYWRETKISEAIDFLMYVKKDKSIQLRHKIINILWYVIAGVLITLWVLWLT